MNKLDNNKIKAALEAILFTMGEAVSADRLAQAVEVGIDELHFIMRGLMEEYNKDDRGIQIIQLEDSYQMGTT